MAVDIYLAENVTQLKSGVSDPDSDLEQDLSTSDEGKKVFAVEQGEALPTVEIAPDISNFSVTNPSGQDLSISFDSDEQAGASQTDFNVEIQDSNSNTVTTLDRTQFTESGSNPWNYSATYTLPAGGDHTVILNTIKDPRGNDGATGQSQTVTVQTVSSYPSVQATSTHDSGSLFGVDVTLPSSGIQAGDLLLAIVAQAASADINTYPSGWTKITEVHNGSEITVGLFAKVAAGGEEGTTVSFDSSSNQQGGAHLYQVRSWGGTIVDDIDYNLTTGSADTPNPPSLTADWGSKDNLWIALTGAGNNGADVTAFPTNYTSGIKISSPSKGQVGSARREFTSDTDDPSNFNLSESEVVIPGTIVIEPGTSGE